jgi:acetoin utilization deacetylase AcuC-like enzyme
MAIAIRVLLRDYGLRQVAVIDCDVHQGNGTAAIFAHDPSVFTCSVHSEKNYPFRKIPSSLDIALSDNTGDKTYLETLRGHIPALLQHVQPEMVWYLAGVDPYIGDRLGRLGLSLHGLRQRDAYILETCRHAGVPVVITLGGGYAPQMHDIVQAHCNTIRMALRIAAAVAR